MDRFGNDVAVAVAKASYVVSPAGRVALTFRPVRSGTTPDGHGGDLYPDDMVDVRLGTDVALVGTSHPPRGKTVERQLVWLSVGPLRKVVQVFGRRTYIKDFGGVVPSAPATLGETPLRYDFAWGGRHPSAPGAPIEVFEEPFNPFGRGYVASPAHAQSLVGTEAPRLEPVADPGTGKTPHASHGCFAPIPANWEPRRHLAGTHDGDWAKTRAPVRPKDFSLSHNSIAVPELHSDKPLVGDEPFEIGGVLAEGLWKFQLPKYGFTFHATVAGEERNVVTHLDTIFIDADERVVELTWRAAIPLPRKWELVERILCRGEGTMPEAVLEADRSTGRSRLTAQVAP